MCPYICSACPWLIRMYFAVQASPAASERLFSQTGLVVASNRNCMSGDTVVQTTDSSTAKAQAK